MSVSQQAFDHAWNHFRIHAAQRMQHWQYSLTFLAAIYAVIATTVQVHMYDLMRLASTIGFVATAVFWALDHRTRTLVKASEAALKDFELEFAGADVEAPIAVFHRSEHDKSFGLSYSHAFALLFLLNSASFVCIAFGTEITSAFNAGITWFRHQ